MHLNSSQAMNSDAIMIRDSICEMLAQVHVKSFDIKFDSACHFINKMLQSEIIVSFFLKLNTLCTKM